MRRLNPSTHGILPIITTGIFNRIVLILDHPKESVKVEMIDSNTAVTVEKLAKVINTKNSAPHTLPPGILIKTCGNVTKIRDGPESGAIP